MAARPTAQTTKRTTARTRTQAATPAAGKRQTAPAKRGAKPSQPAQVGKTPARAKAKGATAAGTSAGAAKRGAKSSQPAQAGKTPARAKQKTTPVHQPARRTAGGSEGSKRTTGAVAATTRGGATVPALSRRIVRDPIVPDPTRNSADNPREERGSSEWSDMNKRMFIERIELHNEIERLEATNNPSNRRIIGRLRRQHESVTMQIIEANYGLLRKYVKLFTGSATREDARDFESAGRLGLMRAIDSYDPYRGSFAQWAFKPIQREVLRAVHSADHNNMNPGDFEKRPEILRALKKLQGENEELRPTEAQVAAEAGVTIEQVKRVLHAPRMDSLYTPVGDGDAILEDLIEDRGGPLDEAVINAIGVETLSNYGLAALDPREYFVLSRRLGLDCEPEQRLSAIGEMLNLSREAVRQIEAKAIAKMSHPVILRLLVRNGKH